MTAGKVNKTARELLVYVLILFVLLLSVMNIENYLTPRKVLGAETKANPEDVFWQDFLNKNPSYIAGWIEKGRMDKANEIDPNYEVTFSVLP